MRLRTAVVCTTLMLTSPAFAAQGRGPDLTRSLRQAWRSLPGRERLEASTAAVQLTWKRISPRARKAVRPLAGTLSQGALGGYELAAGYPFVAGLFFFNTALFAVDVARALWPERVNPVVRKVTGPLGVNSLIAKQEGISSALAREDRLMTRLFREVPADERSADLQTLRDTHRTLFDISLSRLKTLTRGRTQVSAANVAMDDIEQRLDAR